MPLEEFLKHVTDAAADNGGMVQHDHHPEDWANMITPIMWAWAAGYGVGYKRGVSK